MDRGGYINTIMAAMDNVVWYSLPIPFVDGWSIKGHLVEKVMKNTRFWHTYFSHGVCLLFCWRIRILWFLASYDTADRVFRPVEWSYSTDLPSH